MDENDKSMEQALLDVTLLKRRLIVENSGTYGFLIIRIVDIESKEESQQWIKSDHHLNYQLAACINFCNMELTNKLSNPEKAKQNDKGSTV